MFLEAHKREGVMGQLHDKKYLNLREKVWKNILQLEEILQIHYCFNRYFSNPEFISAVCPKTPNITIIIERAFLTEIFIILRRLLSKSKTKEASIIALKDKTLEHCLPRSKDKWLYLRKYINKNIAHSDYRSPVLKNISWSDVDLILDDIKNTFNNVTSEKEEDGYSTHALEVKHLSDKLFKKFLNGVLAKTDMSH